MIIHRRRKHWTAYYVVFTWQGKRVWELSGRDLREAKRLETQRKREVREGTYLPERMDESTTFAQFARQWLTTRRSRTIEDESRWLETYVLGDKFAAKRMSETRPADVLDLIDRLKRTKSERTGALLAPKSVANIYGVVRTIFHDAHCRDLVHRDPCVLPKHTLARKSTVRRAPYSAAEVQRLLACDADADDVMFVALALLTGMREGEVCGRTWADYDDATKPLGALRVHTQYDGAPLKTSTDGRDATRMVPVHPLLARMLERWRSTGFEVVYCRRPRPDDFIVPRRSLQPHTKSSAYKLWLRVCKAAGVVNHSLHSTRHTFITLARRGGARPDVLERVTHNAAGTILDVYTHWEWAPLCEAVQSLALEPVDVSGDVVSPNAIEQGGGAGNRTRDLPEHTSPHDDGSDTEPPKRRWSGWAGPERGANRSARHHDDVGSGSRSAPGPRKALRALSDRDRHVAELLEEAVELSVGDDVAANEDRVHELLVEAAGCRS